MAIADLAPDILPRRYAGFWIRGAALLLDNIILGIPVNLLLVMIEGKSIFSIGANDAFHAGGSGFWILLILGTAYFATMQSSKWQATIGKRLVGIYVIRSDGAQMTFLRALVRFLVCYVSTWILGIGYIMAGLTKEKTALHDLIANTRVVYGKR